MLALPEAAHIAPLTHSGGTRLGYGIGTRGGATR
jgi:hypothetical protein